MRYVHKHHHPPLCRCCGKPLAKYTTGVTLLTKPRDPRFHNDASYHRYIEVDKLPQTKAECQKLTNKKVVHVKRCVNSTYDSTGEWTHTDEGIDRFSVWDGETYTDEFFCSNGCGESFGRLAARSGKIASVAYADAIKEQRGEKVT